MKGKVKKRMMSSLMVAGMITALFAGCSKEGLEDTHVFNEDTSSLSVSEQAEVSSVSSADQETQVITASVAVGAIDPQSDFMKKQAEENEKALAEFKTKTANDMGAQATDYYTILGHQVYKDKDADNYYIWSGPEMLEIMVPCNPSDVNDVIYTENTLYQAVGRQPGSLRTEDGILMANDDAVWVDLTEDAEDYQKVWVDGDYFDIQYGETMGNGNEMKLGALTGGSLTLETAKEMFDAAAESYKINGKKFSVIGGRGALRLLYDGENSFSFMVNKMVLPVNKTTFVVDVEKTLSNIKKEYNTNGVEMIWLEMPVSEQVSLVDPATGEISAVDGVTAGEDGELVISTEMLRQGVGLDLMLSEDGTTLNLITNKELLAQKGAGKTGATREQYEVYETVKRGEDSYTVMVSTLKGREQELAIQREAAEKQQQELEEKAKEESSGSSSNSTGVDANAGGTDANGSGNNQGNDQQTGSGNNNSTGSSGDKEYVGDKYDISGASGWGEYLGYDEFGNYGGIGSKDNIFGDFRGQSEPSFDCPGKSMAGDLDGAKWDPYYGGWVGTVSGGITNIVFPSGNRAYLG